MRDLSPACGGPIQPGLQMRILMFRAAGEALPSAAVKFPRMPPANRPPRRKATPLGGHEAVRVARQDQPLAEKGGRFIY